jgi:hypothetical protein
MCKHQATPPLWKKSLLKNARLGSLPYRGGFI